MEGLIKRNYDAVYYVSCVQNGFKSFAEIEQKLGPKSSANLVRLFEIIKPYLQSITFPNKKVSCKKILVCSIFCKLFLTCLLCVCFGEKNLTYYL